MLNQNHVCSECSRGDSPASSPPAVRVAQAKLKQMTQLQEKIGATVAASPPLYHRPPADGMWPKNASLELELDRRRTALLRVQSELVLYLCAALCPPTALNPCPPPAITSCQEIKARLLKAELAAGPDDSSPSPRNQLDGAPDGTVAASPPLDQPQQCALVTCHIHRLHLFLLPPSPAASTQGACPHTMPPPVCAGWPRGRGCA